MQINTLPYDYDGQERLEVEVDQESHITITWGGTATIEISFNNTHENVSIRTLRQQVTYYVNGDTYFGEKRFVPRDTSNEDGLV